MKRPSLLFGLISFIAFVAPASAQTPALVSPEVHPDRTVTFRLAAPKATEVMFKGDWHSDPMPMTKTAEGVWSITVGPLAPSTYIYGFNMDGIAMADPLNPRIKLRMRTSGSLVEVPAATPSLEEPRDVPHGAIEINWHKSAVLDGETRSIWIYTPPGYAQEPNRRYPVLYLLHGNNDRPAGWIDVGNTNFIADNLIAEKKMTPMIIVMPLGHVLPFGQPQRPPRTNTVVFEEYLLRDVVPLVETKYRISEGRKQRAIAGMSMGGEQSLHVFFNHLDRFAAVGAFSATFRNMETRHAALLADAEAANAKIDLLWLACGRQDTRPFTATEQLSQLLTAKEIRHVWHPTEGAHNYALWRQNLVEFLPLLFREKR